MPKSPLSGAFSGSSEPVKKKNKKNGAILLISGISLATSIGGVFAANSIVINDGDAIQFGQGVAETATCDASIDTSITQKLDGTTTDFIVDTVELTSIDATACADSNLIVTLLKSDNTALATTTIRGNVALYSWSLDGTSVAAGDVGRISITSENYVAP